MIYFISENEIQVSEVIVYGQSNEISQNILNFSLLRCKTVDEVKALIGLGADVTHNNSLCLFQGYEWAPLEYIKVLVEAGAKLNSRDFHSLRHLVLDNPDKRVALFYKNES